jgi:hypothetical protein
VFLLKAEIHTELGEHTEAVEVGITRLKKRVCATTHIGKVGDLVRP